jgi:hypothetical protein
VIGHCWDEGSNRNTIRGKRQAEDQPANPATEAPTVATAALPEVGFLSAGAVSPLGVVVKHRNLGIGRRIINPFNPLCK